MRNKQKILILGAGFGGITTALTLAKKVGKDGCEITLIDKNPHQLYTPALYEITEIPSESLKELRNGSSIIFPIEDIVKNRPINFICDEVTEIKPQTKNIVLKNRGGMAYDFLVLALGSETNYFNIPGLKENSFPLKSFNDGIRLRNELEKKIIEGGHLKIIVGGGGSSGVEMAAEFVNFICLLKKKILQAAKICAVEFLLIEASEQILPEFDEWMIKRASARLKKLGIKIKTGALISAVAPNEITFKNGEKENYDIFIWAGGVKGPSILKNSGLPLSEKGGVLVDEYLRVIESQNIFAVGDNSSFINPKTGKHLRWNVPVAEDEGRIVAENISRAALGLKLKKFVPMKKYPFILAVGKNYAAADLIFIRFSGFVGWFAKMLVELRYLLYILPVKKALSIWIKGFKTQSQ